MPNSGFSQFKLRQALLTLEAGGIIAYPTEAIYGIGCDPEDDDALMEILWLKQRPPEKGLILIAADFNQLQDYIEPLPAAVLSKLHKSWPGPNTWLVPVKPDVSPLLTGGRKTLAVRVTDHPIAAELCRQFGGPLVSTSANLTGLKPAKNAYQVRWQLPEVDYVMTGACGGLSQPSSIRDAMTDEVLR
ncbi:MAG: L-threonylcarbamoyladenylate synthase [Methylophaga sp.]|nr:L-threonylcarbamoyladenylate synthase [Methylophaga sp.]